MPVVAEEQGGCFLQLYLQEAAASPKQGLTPLTSLGSPSIRQEFGAAFLLMLCVPLPSAPPFNSPCSRSVQQGMNFSHKDCQTAPAFHTSGKGAASQNVTAQSLTPHILHPRPPETMAAFPCRLCSGIKALPSAVIKLFQQCLGSHSAASTHKPYFPFICSVCLFYWTTP